MKSTTTALLFLLPIAVVGNTTGTVLLKDTMKLTIDQAALLEQNDDNEDGGNRGLLSANCIQQGDDVICFAFIALLGICEAEWNGKVCDVCAWCPSNSQFSYSCETVADDCSNECVNYDCNEGKCLGCLANDEPEKPTSNCFDGDGSPIPGCECDKSCETCGYYGSPTHDFDCITCADGSDVKAIYGDGTGLCNKESSEDFPCLVQSLELEDCIYENNATCGDTSLSKLWLSEETTLCEEAYDASCTFSEGCPPCAGLVETYSECLLTLDEATVKEWVFEEGMCFTEVCRSTVETPDEQPPKGGDDQETNGTPAPSSNEEKDQNIAPTFPPSEEDDSDVSPSGALPLSTLFATLWMTIVTYSLH